MLFLVAIIVCGLYLQNFSGLTLDQQQTVAKALGLPFAGSNECNDSDDEMQYSSDDGGSSNAGSAKKRRKVATSVASCEKRMSRKKMGDETIAYHLRRVPTFLRDSLLPFQRAGVAFGISKEGRCLIADEMGLGKTIQGIGIAAAYRDEWPLLVVVPAAVKFNWADELERWLPQLGPGRVTVIKNGKDCGSLLKTEVTVVTFSLFTDKSLVAEKLRSKEMKKKFGVIIVDESHSIKTIKAQRTKHLRPLIQGANRRILLSGTPALGRPSELWCQVSTETA
jgi:SNF2 family DNA or RNA helicase